MIKLEVLDKNPLSLLPLIAKNNGYFKESNVEVEIGYVPSFFAFDMTKVTANVGDTTRIFERIASGEELVITSDLTRTMKLILCDDYKERSKKRKLKIISSNDQSLGIYTEYFMQKHNIEFEYVHERNLVKRVELIKSGAVDGACMIDPFLIEFIGNGYFLAYEGKDYPHNYTCWAFHRQYVDTNKDKVIAFHQAMNKAGEYWNKLQANEKYDLACSMLLVPTHLKNYYETLQFNADKPYSKAALETCYEWKCQKNPELKNLKLTDVLLTW